MQDLLTIVEQLDRAATELSTDHPINNRLALILIDNATELMLHGQCTSHLECDSTYFPMLKSYESILERHPEADVSGPMNDMAKHVLTPQQRSSARGKSLPGKLKVLADKGDLTTDERQFIAAAHDYRNELYHVGLAHADIIRAIATHYFLLACDLLPRMRNSFFWSETISSDEKYTDIAKRYLPVRDGKVDLSQSGSGIREHMAQLLRYALPTGIPHLSTVLAHSAENSIKALMQNFQFLVRDNPFSYDEKGMLVVAQWQFDLTKALECKEVDGLWVDPNYRRELEQVASELEETWKPNHRSIPIDSWTRRSDTIRNELDPLTALYKFQSLKKDMAYLEDAFQSASEDLDKWIQHQIDVARGK